MAKAPSCNPQDVPTEPTPDAPDNPAKSVAEVRDELRTQITKLTETARSYVDSIKLIGQRLWTLVSKGDWDGDLTKIEDIPKAFLRDTISQDYKDAIKDATKPGVVGDLMVSQLQGDYLAIQQRAFLARHSGHIRNLTHAASRRRGHGHEAGVLQRGVLGYFEDLLKKSKDAE